jgi:hypothetical protein
MLESKVLQWMARSWNAGWWNSHKRWALILSAPMDGCSVSKRDRILHGSQWVKNLLHHMFIWQRWWQHVKPTLTQDALKDIFNFGEIKFICATKEDSGMKTTQVSARQRLTEWCHYVAMLMAVYPLITSHCLKKVWGITHVITVIQKWMSAWLDGFWN